MLLRRMILQSSCSRWNRLLSKISTISSPSLFRSASASSSFSTNAALNKTTTTLEPISVLKLNNLYDNPGAVKEKRRVGRGIGSGRGKTCGRGHKGQKSRSGGSIPLRFEGGQTSFYKRLPKRGFTNKRHATPMNPINLYTIQMYINMKRLNPNNPITITSMLQAGMFKANAVKHGIKLLSKGTLEQPIHIHVNRASNSAIQAVEELGGTVTSVHYNALALRTMLRPHKYKNDNYKPKHARPPPKLQPYYTNWNKRGYLNPAIQLRQWFIQNNNNNVELLESKFDKIWNEKKQKLLQQQEQETSSV